MLGSVFAFTYLALHLKSQVEKQCDAVKLSLSGPLKTYPLSLLLHNLL